MIMSSKGNDKKLAEEIEHYKDCEEVHDLPPVYHLWSNQYYLQKIQACGYDSLDGFFLDHIQEICGKYPDERIQIASIGAGNCDYEAQLTRGLLDRRTVNFVFHCIELNPHMIDRGRAHARDMGIEDHFIFEVKEIENWKPDTRYRICMANQSLHHIVGLEDLFSTVKRVIDPDGVFLVHDMIGRNGHMRWPEAQLVVDLIWGTLPDRYKYNHQYAQIEHDYVNRDCSGEGNEGVRAQDILPLLIQYFHFESFIACANIIYAFIDRGFGHNFDPRNPVDVNIINRIAKLDEEMMDQGMVKPTHMLAALRVEPVSQTRAYRHWTPEFCVRWP